jgi:Mn-dependent DtxR family transcriptional regulator
MKRNKTLIQKREDFIKQFVNNHKSGVTTAVQKVSDRLFISESTVWKELKK